MRLSVTPMTSWGKWSVGLAVAFALLFALFLALVASGQRGPVFNPLLAAVIMPAALAGIGAFVTGVISLVKKERSLTVILTTVIGWWVLVFVLGEFLSPH